MQRIEMHRRVHQLIVAASISCAAVAGINFQATTSHAQTKAKPPAKSKPTTKANAQAEISDASELPRAPSTGRVTANTPVTTSAEAVRLIDLRQFPKLNPLQTLDDSPTLVFYSAKGNVASAMAFFNSELSNSGWKEVQNTTPDSPQYRDVLYTKSGYYLRLNVGEGSEEGQISVNLTNLGNVDLSNLPQMPKSKPNEYTSPINASFETEQGIREAVKFCREELAKLGWQEYGGMHPGVPDVPHVKQMDFIKNGLRIMVNVSRDPRLPNGNKTMVSYMAQHVLPHDIPVSPQASELKLDIFQNRAEYKVNSTLEEAVQYYRDQAIKLGWKPQTESEKVNDQAATLFMADEEKAGFVIAIRPADDGGLKVSMERLSFEKSSSSDAPTVADTDSPAVDESDTDAAAERSTPNTPDPTDIALDRMQEEIQKAVAKELQGVESELGNLGVPSDVLSLVEEAKKLADAQEDEDDDEEEDEDDEDEGDDADELTAANDESAQQLAKKRAEADAALASLRPLATRCLVTLGDTKHEWKNGLALRNPENDSTVVMFCEKPLNASKAQRMLAQGEVPSIHDLMGSGFSAGMEIRMEDSMTWIGCFVDGNSINRGSSDFKTDVLAGNKRARGTVTAEPDEVFDKKFVFEASFDLEIISKSANGPAATSSNQLVADAGYDLPVPEGCQGAGTEKTPYTTNLTTQHEASVADLATFYRRELTTLGYREKAAQAKIATDSASLTFAGSSGPATLGLKRSGDTTEIQLSIKDQAKAQKDGMVAAAGQGLLLIANGTPQPITITLGKHVQKVASGKGRDNPKDAARIPVLPGKHRVKIEMGGETKNEEITIDAGSTWGIFAVPELGPMVQQIY